MAETLQMLPNAVAWDIKHPLPKPEFGHWFAGFCDGESTLTVMAREVQKHGSSYIGYELHISITIILRADDEDVLRHVMDETGVGRMFWRTSNTKDRNASPQCGWSAQKRSDCERIAEILTEYPLRSKKRYEFPLWREALSIKREAARLKRVRGTYNDRLYTDDMWRRVQAIDRTIKEMRKFDG